jgi:hypothetical protein
MEDVTPLSTRTARLTMGIALPSGNFINGIFMSRPAMLGRESRDRELDDDLRIWEEFDKQRKDGGALEIVNNLDVLSINWDNQ